MYRPAPDSETFRPISVASRVRACSSSKKATGYARLAVLAAAQPWHQAGLLPYGLRPKSAFQFSMFFFSISANFWKALLIISSSCAIYPSIITPEVSEAPSTNMTT